MRLGRDIIRFSQKSNLISILDYASELNGTFQRRQICLCEILKLCTLRYLIRNCICNSFPTMSRGD